MRIKLSQSRYMTETKNVMSFIIFSFLNTFLPIALCIVASFVSETGPDAVMAIGYLSPFMMGFMQLSISFGIWTFNTLVKRTHFTEDRELSKSEFDRVFSSSVFLSIAMGLILVMFYALFTFLYIYFSTNRPNTQLTLEYGYDFIGTTIIYVLLVCLKSNLILYIYYYDKKSAVILEILFQMISILIAFAVGVGLDKKVFGIGMSLSLMMVLYVAFLSWYISKRCSFHMYRFSWYRFADSFAQFKKLLSESVSGLSMALFKGIALFALGLTISNKMKSFVPLSFQMGRVIWFNYMSFLPFISIGISNAIEYYDLFKPLNSIKFNSQFRKKYWFYLIFSMTFTLFISVAAMFLVRPLVDLYVHNASLDLPAIKALIDSNMYDGIPIPLDHLPPNKLPPLSAITMPSELKERVDLLQEAYKAAAGSDGVLSKWEMIKFVSKNKQLIKEVASGLKIWIETGTANPISKEWIDWILGFKNEDDMLALIAYAYGDPTTFKNFMIDYIKFTSLDPNTITALMNYSIGFSNDSILVNVLHFQSKTMIYIIAYSVLYCGWTILIPASRKIQNRKVHWAIIAVVYALCIGGVVVMGIIFTLYFATWWPNAYNPFQYMDAWTFPALLAGSIVSTYLWIKWIVLNVVDHKKTKKTYSRFI